MAFPTISSGREAPSIFMPAGLIYTILPAWWIKIASAECSTSDRYFSSLSRSCTSSCFKGVISWIPARNPWQTPSASMIGVVAISVWMRAPSLRMRLISKTSCEF
ncbi:hypothetical protein DSECCO2_494210 [anaerobic digester metagenome]